MRTTAILAVLATLGLAACQTTQDAAIGLEARYLGQPVDRFFIENGPPIARFQLQDGSTLYTWRGGETSYTRPGQVTTQPAPGTASGVTTIVQPPTIVNLLCEVQITANPGGAITDMRVSRDTEGSGLSFSRCAELFALPT